MQCLFPGHGGAFGHILGAVGDLPVQHQRLPDVGIDAYITHGNAAAEVLCQYRRTGFGMGQVDGLHQRHRLGRAGHALFHHAVVSGKHQQVLPGHSDGHFPGDARQLDGQILQPSQASGGLGQLGLPFSGFRHGGLVQRGNFAEQLFQFRFHVHSSRIRFSSSQRIDVSASGSSRVQVAPGHRSSTRESSSAMGRFPSGRLRWSSASP